MGLKHIRLGPDIAEIVKAQHIQACLYNDLNGKGRTYKNGNVLSERSFLLRAERSTVAKRIEYLNPLVSKNSIETLYWKAPKGVCLGWPLSVSSRTGDIPDMRFGRVQKIVDLTRETMDCISVKSNDPTRIKLEISQYNLRLDHEAADLKRLKAIVKEWHAQDGVTIIFSSEHESTLVFCTPRTKHYMKE